ncbi:MAG TPA: nuclear transport factor 2 family protein [Steroidobacteraceae bacterium]|nr:nuclear transport factor 2 family protein [Steroidobacteraceae bacterium]
MRALPGQSALVTTLDRLESASAIKRLQRAFGYYFDAGCWDEAAALFAEDGTIELGLDGVYRGRERVREYLYALGGGCSGLERGTLREWFQLQPVVHLAADGNSAKARWRTFLIAGQLGERALWGEGPYENEYARRDGVWRIRRLHWYDTLIVPYEGGFVRHRDATAGRLLPAGANLVPDAPPSEPYEPWPGVYTPPFHYTSPTTALDLASPEPGHAPDEASAARALQSLTRRVLRLDDAAQIENLISAYGYYLDKQVWDALAQLFAADATMEISQRGVYLGRASIRRALELFGPPGVERNHLHNHQQLQPVIHVAPDGRRAWARSRAFGQLGAFEGAGIWHGGVYENEFVKEDGIWKFARDHVYTTYFAHYDSGWMSGPRPTAKASEKIPPDRPPSVRYESFPEVYIPPFHYPHPVTGAAPGEPHPTDPATAPLERRVVRLEDERALENLQRSYGYYVDKALWAEAADLFSEDGTLEIGGRGVFVGKRRVLEYLRWLAPEGLTRGRLFDHMQLQPVISLADDGKSAHGRWRFFAQVGEHLKSGLWGLGTYENTYAKEHGVWRIRTLHATFRMYTPYAEGWGRAALPNTHPERDLPPDRPPSVVYETYPGTYIPPPHYRHPVTGA